MHRHVAELLALECINQLKMSMDDRRMGDPIVSAEETEAVKVLDAAAQDIVTSEYGFWLAGAWEYARITYICAYADIVTPFTHAWLGTTLEEARERTITDIRCCIESYR